MINRNRFPAYRSLPKPGIGRSAWIWILWVLFFFLLWLSSLLYREYSTTIPRILLFPTAKSDPQNLTDLYAETRYIPKPVELPSGWSRTERLVYYTVKELIYGPDNILAYPFLSNNTVLTSVSVTSENVYLVFSHHLKSEEGEYPVPLRARLELIRRAVLINFGPTLKHVLINIENEPVPPPAEPA